MNGYGPCNRVFPSYEHHHGLDAESDQVILFGGGPLEGAKLDDTWGYDFNTNTWTNMNPATNPPSRFEFQMAYDTESDRIILFGGYKAGMIILADTWAYDFNINTQMHMTPAASPSARGNHGMVYDGELDRVILFGGVSEAQILSDTWTYDFNTNIWTHTTSTPHPAGHGRHTMAYNRESDQVILFGGEKWAGMRNDTWAYNYPTSMEVHEKPTGAATLWSLVMGVITLLVLRRRTR